MSQTQKLRNQRGRGQSTKVGKKVALSRCREIREGSRDARVCVLYNVCDGATKRQMPFTLGWININFGFKTPISTYKWGYQ
jgi:hypothetical protein